MYHQKTDMQTPQGITLPALVLSAADVRGVLDMPTCIGAVEQAFRMLGNGSAPRPVVSSVRTPEGGFHIKSALFGGYFVSKTNANYPGNAAKHGLPTVQGTIVVHDASNGVVLAVIDSIEITAMRTAAATAIAAKYLAREDSETLAIVGCGVQGLYHIRALSVIRPLRTVCLFDVDRAASAALERRVQMEFGLSARVASSIDDAVKEADITATCTTSTEFLLDAGAVPPGAFVAGVGVDAEHKRELSPELLRRARVVADVLEQCAVFGDLHHAIEQGVMTTGDVHAELGAIVAGARPGRTSRDETFVFDSTGMALQDAAAAVLVVERARSNHRGLEVTFSA